MKIKTSINYILAICLLPLVGFSQDKNFAIEGKLHKKHNGNFVKIYYQNGSSKKIDSTQIKNGQFVLKGDLVAPTLGKISLDNEKTGDQIDIFLANGTIKLIAKDSIRYANVNGTALTDDHERLAKIIRPLDQPIFDGFAAFQKMPEGAEKKAYLTSLMKGLDQYNQKKRQIIHQFVTDNPSSYVSLFHLDKISPASITNYETTYPFFSKLTTELQQTQLGKQLENRLLAAKGKLDGEVFKDFVSTTPEGNSLTLREIITKNKYTLVDFWASWCAPCRKENPNVVKAYNAFKDKGFTVLSVSLDKDGSQWKAAIEADGMPWHHVSTLKGWEEPAAVLYSIRAIPQNILIDGKGKIIATNLKVETLYNKIQQLLD
ncbi:MAG: TlpA disulfide reductase family protein [Pedobacter sp.]|uniref:TlpA disulfide reductase family protein n=1 Tax=Pedobacter sp. TaxID=1411316 RepID=UPI002809986E|nr:TlpA disulfide reductase family protein [Pedobacter sp.]MDQ8006073.1 TlpA disulfide reductase family protein [Pedobacter sp.]